MQFFYKIKERFKVSGIWSTIMYIFFTVYLEKIGFHIDAVFSYQIKGLSSPSKKEFSFRVIHSMQDLGEKDEASLKEYGGAALIDEFAVSFSGGELCALACWEQQLGCVCWGKKIQHHPVIGEQSAFLVWRCFTLPGLRGRGLYPQTLSHFCSMLKSQEFSGSILIECSIFNQSSLKGIQKAGFRIIGKILRFGRWSKAFKVKDTAIQI